MTATDFGLNGLPRSLRWPCSASDAEIARRLNAPPFGFLRASRFASATTSGRVSTWLFALDLLAGRHALAPPRRRKLGHKGRLLELSDGAQHLTHQHGGRCVLDKVHGRRRCRHAPHGVAVQVAGVWAGAAELLRTAVQGGSIWLSPRPFVASGPWQRLRQRLVRG